MSRSKSRRATAAVGSYVDKRRFERIVTNLIENAERYGGGVTAVVTVERR